MTYTREQLESLLALEDFHDIYAQADALRRETVGDVVHIRALLEFSNHCKRLCTYCGLNATDQKLSRFRMDPRDMIATAQEAARAGYRTIVLQSGEDPWYTPDRIGDIVKQIKKTGMAITLSCGEFPEDGTAARTVICLNTKHPTQRSMPPCTPTAPWTRAWRACER